MAIIKKNLGNRADIIQKRFRSYYNDGYGGLRFDVFKDGWSEGFEECKKLLKAKNDKLKEEMGKSRKCVSCDNMIYYETYCDNCRRLLET